MTDSIVLAGTEHDADIPKAESQTVLESVPAQKIDFIFASKQDLGDLSGVGVVLAQKAIEMRVQINELTSATPMQQQAPSLKR